MRRLPLTDTRTLRGAARRTRIAGLVLGAALVVLVVALVFTTRVRPPAADILPSGASGIVVLDLSGSTRNYPAPIANALRQLTRDGERRLGLVVFSDTAYEALPPHTPGDGLRGWLEEFENSEDPRYPWSTFSGGTAISSGLALARSLVLRNHLAHPHVLLVSDLVDDDGDLERLASVVADYQRDRIDLRVISVTGKDTSFSPLANLQVRNAAFVGQAASARFDSKKLRAQPVGLLEVALLVVLLAVALSAFELAFHPLAWGRAAT